MCQRLFLQKWGGVRKRESQTLDQKKKKKKSRNTLPSKSSGENIVRLLFPVKMELDLPV